MLGQVEKLPMVMAILLVGLSLCYCQGRNKAEEPICPTLNNGKGEKRIITPGKGWGSLIVGASKKDLVKSLGKSDEEYTYSQETGCGITDMHWLVANEGGDGIFAYLKAEIIYQISFSGSDWITDEGISIYSSTQKVESVYNTKKFRLTGSAGKINGGKDLTFLVEQSKGIAFEFYYDQNAKVRKVWSITVFDPKQQFLPNGCVSQPQDYLEEHK